MSTVTTPLPASHGSEPSRRDFLYITTATVAAVGTAATIWPMIDQMNPDARTLAAGGPVEIDISALQPGQQIVASWQSHPVFVQKRTPEGIAKLNDPTLLARLSDPDSETLQQPDYIRNATRSVKPGIGVYVGVCTHLGCIPNLFSAPNATTPAPDWPGGYFCPCHGSKYDLAGRVFKGVPAPYNLPAPPYHFTNDKVVRIGENPAGATFEFSSIVQL
jgi:ubiquinol-cytochrome c reductase iron-sulfur subunit